MTDEFSRRNFVALATAAAATSLASCAKAKSEGADQTVEDAVNLDTLDTPYEFRGEFPTYGANPNHTPTYRAPIPETVPFKPKHIAIIQIRSPKAWLLDINHAHFSVDENYTDQQRLERAISLIGKKGASKKFRDISSLSDKPFVKQKPPSIGDSADYSNFAKLGFGSQHELFVYFEATNIAFKSGHLFTFAPKTHRGADAAENYAFFDAEVVPYSSMGNLKNKGRMLRLKNYYTDDTGVLIPEKAEEITYAMNIHVEMKIDEGDFVPMIIDPDTGNGSGNEP